MNFTNEIRETRFHDFTLDLKPAYADKLVSVSLEKHDFLFGSNLFALVKGIPEESKDDFAQKFLKVFNAATLPFYWGIYEPEEGRTNESALLATAGWAKDNGLTLKGHPLCWHTVCAGWLMQYDNKKIYKKQMDRIKREVSAFKGLIDSWDVINETVIMPVYDRYDNAVTRIAKEYGRDRLAIDCFQTAKEENPESVLLINDFNLSEKYAQVIETLLDKGCRIDVIGLQTHQHQGYFGVEYIAEVLERFTKFGLPLHFTENTIISGEIPSENYKDLNDIDMGDWPSTEEGEERQSSEVEEFYSQLYANPLVESIVWWDMFDGLWLNAPSGLMRRDFSTKPAYHTLERLINEEWGFKTKDFKADSKARIRFRGPAGKYRIKVDGKEFMKEFSKTGRNLTQD